MTFNTRSTSQHRYPNGMMMLFLSVLNMTSTVISCPVYRSKDEVVSGVLQPIKCFIKWLFFMEVFYLWGRGRCLFFFPYHNSASLYLSQWKLGVGVTLIHCIFKCHSTSDWFLVTRLQINSTSVQCQLRLTVHKTWNPKHADYCTRMISKLSTWDSEMPDARGYAYPSKLHLLQSFRSKLSYPGVASERLSCRSCILEACNQVQDWERVSQSLEVIFAGINFNLLLE